MAYFFSFVAVGEWTLFLLQRGAQEKKFENHWCTYLISCPLISESKLYRWIAPLMLAWGCKPAGETVKGMMENQWRFTSVPTGPTRTPVALQKLCLSTSYWILKKKLCYHKKRPVYQKMIRVGSGLRKKHEHYLLCAPGHTCAMKTTCFPLNFFSSSLTRRTWIFWKDFSWGTGTKMMMAFRLLPTSISWNKANENWWTQNLRNVNWIHDASLKINRVLTKFYNVHCMV